MVNPVKRVRDFYAETTTELKKCTWPTRSELMESTLVVIVSVMIICLFVAAVDWLSQLAIRLLTVA